MELGNQQERPQVLSHDFVGGLITGEGWFGLTMQTTPRLKTKHGYTITPRFAMQMNDFETMSRFLATLDEWECGYYIPRLVKRPTKAQRDGLRVEIVGMKRVKKFIDIVVPHLAGQKRQAAEIVQQYVDLRLSKAQAAPYGEEEFELVNRLRYVNGANRSVKVLVESSETRRRTPVNLSGEDIVRTHVRA
jgi:hypothetical protein